VRELADSKQWSGAMAATLWCSAYCSPRLSIQRTRSRSGTSSASALSSVQLELLDDHMASRDSLFPGTRAVGESSLARHRFHRITGSRPDGRAVSEGAQRACSATLPSMAESDYPPPSLQTCRSCVFLRWKPDADAALARRPALHPACWAYPRYGPPAHIWSGQRVCPERVEGRTR